MVRQPSLRDLAARRAGGLRRDGEGGDVPAGTAAAVRAKAAGKLDPARDPRARGAHAPRRDRVPDPRRGAGGRAGALAAPGDDVVRRAGRVAGDPAGRGGRPDPRRRRPAARRLPAPRRRAPRDGRDRPLARHPRRADHGRPGVRGLLRRAGPRQGARWNRPASEIAVGKIAGAVGTYANLDPAVEQARAGVAGPAAARWSRPRSWRAIGTRRTSWRWRGWAPPSSGWRSPSATGSAPRSARRGGVRQGAEGLVGDAAQEEPDPVREPVRHRAPAALVRQRRRSRTSRCGTSATSRTRRSSA